MKIKDHYLIYNVSTKRFRFTDDDILYYKQEKDTRENINFKRLQKYMRRILSTVNGILSDRYDFVLNDESYHIFFEDKNMIF